MNTFFPQGTTTVSPYTYWEHTFPPREHIQRSRGTLGTRCTIKWGNPVKYQNPEGMQCPLHRGINTLRGLDIRHTYVPLLTLPYKDTG